MDCGRFGREIQPIAPNLRPPVNGYNFIIDMALVVMVNWPHKKGLIRVLGLFFNYALGRSGGF